MVESAMTYKEAEQRFGSQYSVKAAVINGALFYQGHGLYTTKPHVSKFEVITKKYPNAIITADTAYYLYGLTDTVPEKIHLATKRNATRISDGAIVQVFVDQRFFSAGKSQIDYDGITVNIYDKERLLVELLRKNNSMPFDYYKELIASYRKLIDSLDYYKIDSYIRLYKRNDFLFEALQREVF